MIFGVNNLVLDGVHATEKMRLNHDGVLLVGTTDTSLSSNTSGGNTGIIADGQGVLQIARETTTNTQGLVSLNKMGEDGNIIELYKNGASVGSIGATAGDLMIGTTDTGFRFLDGSEQIIPWNVTGNTNKSGVLDLGNTTNRFANLYLSGGVFLGGTETANKLQDYEEGTWTPVFSDAASGGNQDEPTTGKRGQYTKIGRQVTVSLSTINLRTVGMTAGSDFYIQGLPFAPISVSSPNQTYTGSVRSSNITFNGSLTAELIDNTTYFRLSEVVSGAVTDRVRVTEIADNTADLDVTITYFTNA